LKILFTGASSFTGCWFVRELCAAQHAVTAIFQRPAETYAEPLRRSRVEQVAGQARTVFGCGFGDDNFLKLIEQHGPWDVLCHHAADVTNYKSADFDVARALGNNTHQLPKVLAALAAGGCRRVVLTGTVFEQDEGAGSEGLPAFSPYGLAKGLTAQAFRYYAGQAGMQLTKFVIPNPFGPYEEPRFVHYLMKNWFDGKKPSVKTPAYVRDNIHVSLLAKVYAQATAAPDVGPGMLTHVHPSGYVESQGAFAQRLAREVGPRLGMACPLELVRQTDFSEPRVRINTDVPDAAAVGWDEAQAWDQIADYYRKMYGR